MGNWYIEIINIDGKIYHFSGILGLDIKINDISLSDLIRDKINIDNLYLFDGNYKPNKINKIIIKYNRYSKIETNMATDKSKEFVIWNYSESIVIDRETETIKHKQIIGTGCSVSRNFHVHEGVKLFLDDYDGDTLFKIIEGNPPDTIENPNRTQEYKIVIESEKEDPRIIMGTYDKKGLPKDWNKFAKSLLDFILFYGLGEILDPSIYNKVKRRKGEYIYCSVYFDDSYKTYYYLTDDDSIKIGDLVVVPAGADNDLSVVEIVNIQYFKEEDVPFPLSKTKKIIEKYNYENFE